MFSSCCCWKWYFWYHKVQWRHFSGVVDRFKNTYVEFLQDAVHQKLFKSVYFHGVIKNTLEKLPSIEVGPTIISLTHDVDLWPWPSIPCKLWPWHTHVQKFKVNGQSVPKLEWKQTAGRTDRRTEAIALPPTLMRSVNVALFRQCRHKHNTTFAAP